MWLLVLFVAVVLVYSGLALYVVPERKRQEAEHAQRVRELWLAHGRTVRELYSSYGKRAPEKYFQPPRH